MLAAPLTLPQLWYMRLNRYPYDAGMGHSHFLLRNIDHLSPTNTEFAWYHNIV